MAPDRDRSLTYSRPSKMIARLIPAVIALSALGGLSPKHAEGALTRSQACQVFLSSGLWADTTQSSVWCPNFGSGTEYDGLFTGDSLAVYSGFYGGPALGALGTETPDSCYIFWGDGVPDQHFGHVTACYVMDASTGAITLPLFHKSWPIVANKGQPPLSFFESIEERSTNAPRGAGNPQGLIAGIAWKASDMATLPRSFTPPPNPIASSANAAAIVVHGAKGIDFQNDATLHAADLIENLGIPAPRVLLVTGANGGGKAEFLDAVDALLALSPPPSEIYLRVSAHSNDLLVRFRDGHVTQGEMTAVMQDLAALGVPIHVFFEFQDDDQFADVPTWGLPAGSTVMVSSWDLLASDDQAGAFVGPDNVMLTGSLYTLAITGARKVLEADLDGNGGVDEMEKYSYVHAPPTPVYRNVLRDESNGIPWHILPAGNDPVYRQPGIVRALARRPSVPYPSGARTSLLYTGADVDILNQTWAPKPGEQADSLNSYAALSTGPYRNIDRSSPPPGQGQLWHLVPGNNVPTGDACAPEKNLQTDKMFLGAHPAAHYLIPHSFNSAETFPIPVPSGSGSIRLRWTTYSWMPRGSGYVQLVDYRVFKGGRWHGWKVLTTRTGAPQTWTDQIQDVPDAAPADSIQVRFTSRCSNEWAGDGTSCGETTTYGVMYDNLGIIATAGIPRPGFSIFPGDLPQSTFVDGTMPGLNCSAIPCWPGIRGSQALSPAGRAITDNFNSPTGDSSTVMILGGVRPLGMGINWQFAYDLRVSEGTTIAHTNGAFNPAFDTPRWIYRIFDPATTTWSPWDSSALDVDNLRIWGADTLVFGDRYRFDWPPRDKVAASASLPGGFTINGAGSYSALSFLGRGTRIQYYLKAVDILGRTTYQFQPDAPSLEAAELPTLPGGSVRAPDIIEFDVLPGAYPFGSMGSQLGAANATPVLVVDGAYTGWSHAPDPIQQALLGLGVRADRYRLLQSLGTGANIGGHTLAGDAEHWRRSHFPNPEEYGIIDSLARWYRIVIHSDNRNRDWPSLEDQDAKVLDDWWKMPTGTDGGDRCLFVSGDDLFLTLLNPAPGFPGARQEAFTRNILGVDAAADTWSLWGANRAPVMDDRFSAPSAGPALGAPGGFTYPIDGGCPAAPRPDALTKMAIPEAANVVTYPSAQAGAVAQMAERDPALDHDRNKAIGYGFSIQSVRQTGFSPAGTSHENGGFVNRMRILYKFLTSCRAGRAASDTASCWPCPTDSSMFGNWATLAGFQTGTYGPLYAIQDPGAITAVPVPGEDGTYPSRVNMLRQNRPNPFNPETIISFEIAVPGRVAIRIFDVGGRLIRTLTDRILPAGPHEIRWYGELDSGARASSGVYFYRINYPDGTVSGRKMIMLR